MAVVQTGEVEVRLRRRAGLAGCALLALLGTQPFWEEPVALSP